jgi:hypothetical protein
MATIRSISASKPPERLLTRRLTRTSTSSSLLPPKKVTLSKTTPVTVKTINRRKSSRMSSKKGSIESNLPLVRHSSFTTITTTDNTELTNKMASTTINELPQIKPHPRVSDAETISNTPVSSTDPDAILDNKQTEESHNDNHMSNNLNETSLSSSVSSRKSSTENIQFTTDSLDTIRTVGTGRILDIF